MVNLPSSRRAERFPLRIAAIAVASILAASPAALAAQDPSAPASLEDLIPDAAIENPEDWARKGTDAGSDESEDPTSQQLDADSPLADLPTALDWPDDLEIDDPEPVEPEDVDEAFLAADDLELAPHPELEEFAIGSRLLLGFPDDADGFPERTEFLDRFRALSTVRELGGSEQNVAQLAARAREDQELLQRLLRVYGYYDAQIIRSLGGLRPGDEQSETEPRVRFDILPGQRYSIDQIDLGNLDTAPDYPELRAAFGIESGDPLSSDRIVEERFSLDSALGESGYPYAEIADPELLVDHARVAGDLTIPVQPGGKYVFGEVTSSLPEFLSGRHLGRIARFDAGDTYQRSLEQDLRRAIIATGLVSSATLTTRVVREPADGEPGEVAIDADIQKAKVRTIAGAIGYGTEEGVRVEASWEHRNFFPPEGAVKVRGIVGTREQLAGISFKRNNFRARDQLLNLDAYASDIETDAVEARTVALRGSVERVSNLLFQKPLSWALGAEVLFSDERNRVIGGIPRPRQTYLIGSVFGQATVDGSDSLLDPTRGYRVTAFLAPETSRNSDTQTNYLRGQLDASYYQPVGEGVVAAARARFATIQGAQTFEIAPSRRLYAGGGGSVRGYGYQAVGPRNDFGEPTGGRSLAEFSLEARIDTGFLDGAVQVVPFFDLGTVSLDTVPDFRFVQYGAGLGLRYKTGFGPIRVDVGVPLNRNPMFDSPVAVYVSLGQAF